MQFTRLIRVFLYPDDASHAAPTCIIHPCFSHFTPHLTPFSPPLPQVFDVYGFYPPINQIEISPQFRSAEIISFCNRKGILVEAYAPFGDGDRSHIRDDAHFPPIAAAHKATVGQVMLSWALAVGADIVIPRSHTPAHQAENLALFTPVVTLNETEISIIGSVKIMSKVYDTGEWAGADAGRWVCTRASVRIFESMRQLSQPRFPVIARTSYIAFPRPLFLSQSAPPGAKHRSPAAQLAEPFKRPSVAAWENRALQLLLHEDEQTLVNASQRVRVMALCCSMRVAVQGLMRCSVYAAMSFPFNLKSQRRACTE